MGMMQDFEVLRQNIKKTDLYVEEESDDFIIKIGKMEDEVKLLKEVADVHTFLNTWTYNMEAHQYGTLENAILKTIASGKGILNHFAWNKIGTRHQHLIIDVNVYLFWFKYRDKLDLMVDLSDDSVGWMSETESYLWYSSHGTEMYGASKDWHLLKHSMMRHEEEWDDVE